MSDYPAIEQYNAGYMAGLAAGRAQVLDEMPTFRALQEETNRRINVERALDVLQKRLDEMEEISHDELRAAERDRDHYKTQMEHSAEEYEAAVRELNAAQERVRELESHFHDCVECKDCALEMGVKFESQERTKEAR